jgi:hypothetical protein
MAVKGFDTVGSRAYIADIRFIVFGQAVPGRFCQVRRAFRAARLTKPSRERGLEPKSKVGVSTALDSTEALLRQGHVSKRVQRSSLNDVFGLGGIFHPPFYEKWGVFMRTLVWVVCLLIPLVSFASDPLPLTNWPVPGRSGDVSAMADLGGASIFVAVTPCRVVDTRNAIGAYGGPKPTAGTTRTFDIDSGPCTGIPNGAASYSLSFGVTQTDAGGFLTAWNTGGSQPVVATMTWFGANQTLSNAAIVPASSAGAINVFLGAGTHLTIDINGYYMDSGGNLNTGVNLWVEGSVSGTGVVRVQNNNTASTSALTSALRGVIQTTANGPTALSAEQLATSGANYGVHANNNSLSQRAYGVLGRGGNAAWGSPNVAVAGVRGIAGGGSFNYGLMGEGLTGGVIGYRTDAAGVTQTSGIVAFSGSTGLYTAYNLSVVGTKSFVEPHPSDASKIIKYVALEGAEAGTYFRGRGRVRNGVAIIQVPDDFRMVSDSESLTVQITPVGQMANYAVASLDLNRVVIQASRDIEFFYLVQGVRKAFKEFIPVQEAVEEGYFLPKGPDDRLDNYASNAEHKQRLIQNGTFNEDGSVNLGTAERQGWAQQWRERDAAIRATQMIGVEPAADDSMRPASPGKSQ